MSALISAPTGLDAQTLRAALSEISIGSSICSDVQKLSGSVDASTSFLVLTEEALGEGFLQLLEVLEGQETWSDIPILLLSAAGSREASSRRAANLEQLRNFVILERPLPKKTFQGAARAAVRARERQYRTRDHLEQLRDAREELEQRVTERTAELRTEIAERESIEHALNHAQKLEAVGRLTGGVAHDFNNLLQVILNGISVLERMPEDAERRSKILESMRKAGQRGASVTKQMLAFARRQPLNAETVDIATCVGGLAHVLNSALPATVELKIEVPADIWPVEADMAQLEVALLNLCLNARDAIEGSGWIKIAAENLPGVGAGDGDAAALVRDRVSICVRDSGSGMDGATQERAFEPFFTTKEVGSGTGLGLSQVYGFARQSGGTATIISTRGHGTTVTMTLPRTTRTSIGVGDKRPAVRIRAPDGRVLVVEDEPLVAEAAIEMLLTFGIAADHVLTGDAALTMPLESYAGLISDVIMPGSIDGIELAQQVRQRFPRLPLLLVSDYAGDPTRLRTSGFDVLVKPYSADELARALVAAGIAADERSD